MIAGRLMAMSAPGLERLQAFIDAGERKRTSLWDDDDDEPRAGGYRVRDSIAIVPVLGPISSGSSWWCRTSYPEIAQAVLAAAGDVRVRTIALSVDSPGGELDGVDVAVQALRVAGAQKRVITYVTGECCSGAYWLASATSEVIVAPASISGCLGVIVCGLDWTGALEKEGIKRITIRSSQTPSKALPISTPEGRDACQVMLDAAAAVMLGQIAQFRRVKPDAIAAQYGRGASMLAPDALAAGLVDRITADSDRWLTVGGPAPLSYQLAPAPVRAAIKGNGMEIKELPDGFKAVSGVDLAALQAQAAKVEALEKERDVAQAEARVLAASQAEVGTRLAKLEADLTAAADKDRVRERDAILDRHIAAGRFAPTQRAEMSKDADDMGNARFDALMSKLPGKVPTGPVGVTTGGDAPDLTTREGIAAAARTLMASQKLTFADAMGVVMKQNPAAAAVAREV